MDLLISAPLICFVDNVCARLSVCACYASLAVVVLKWWNLVASTDLVEFCGGFSKFELVTRV